MNRNGGLKLLPGLVLGVALAGPAFAQSAGQKMHEAWHSTENAAGHAWQGTKTAVSDTDITSKLEMSLHNDKMTRGQDIHVNTNGGVVTLTGHAPKSAAARAARIARETSGVVSVNNDIRAHSSVSARD